MPAEGTLIIHEIEGEERLVRLEDRNRPFRPWSNPTNQNVVTTQYPGNPRKTVQILGPFDDRVVFNGKIRDWWNHEGFADDLEALLRSICNDGMLLEVEILGWRRQCIMTRFEPDNQYTGFFEYEMEFEVLGIEEAPPAFSGEIDTPSELAADTDTSLVVVEDLRTELPLSIPELSMAPFDTDMAQLRQLVDEYVGEIGESNAAAQAIDTARRVNETATRTLSLVQDAQTQTRLARSRLSELTPDLLSQLPDAQGLLDTSGFRVGIITGLRTTGLQLRRSEDFFREAADSTVLTTVNGRAGRSLAELALRYYGTVHDWPRIARANGLRDNYIETAVELIIPA